MSGNTTKMQATAAGLLPEQVREIRETTVARIRQAAAALGHDFSPIPVHFDLGGGTAGMYRVRGGERWIRYNPWLFRKYYAENLVNTVAHEVAHYVTDCLWGLGRIRPHGAEWRSVMALFGVPPQVRAEFDLEGIPGRRERRFPYLCACGPHWLTARRHNRVLRQGVRYRCRRCGEDLRLRQPSGR